MYSIPQALLYAGLCLAVTFGLIIVGWWLVYRFVLRRSGLLKELFGIEDRVPAKFRQQNVDDRKQTTSDPSSTIRQRK